MTGRETARSSATRCSVWYCLREGVATRGGPGWLCRKHADEYDECGWGAAPSSGREATCKITTPHQHSSFDDPIDCPYTEGREAIPECGFIAHNGSDPARCRLPADHVKAATFSERAHVLTYKSPLAREATADTPP